MRWIHRIIVSIVVLFVLITILTIVSVGLGSSSGTRTQVDELTPTPLSCEDLIDKYRMPTPIFDEPGTGGWVECR